MNRRFKLEDSIKLKKRRPYLGGSCSGGTPVPISNTEVKPTSADDSRKAKVGCRQDKVFF